MNNESRRTAGSHGTSTARDDVARRTRSAVPRPASFTLSMRAAYDERIRNRRGAHPSEVWFGGLPGEGEGGASPDGEGSGGGSRFRRAIAKLF